MATAAGTTGAATGAGWAGPRADRGTTNAVTATAAASTPRTTTTLPADLARPGQSRRGGIAVGTPMKRSSLVARASVERVAYISP
ncbi:Uncharacterised protein [Amycolatopsis camponoti]|uniref:Uncharacterized protein n=1 Tax=Amycolatopsis camponoti TaxID=2606593 RepID=A0A6I8M0S7_9PSEU|nr:Uncharacterised protein [Amycolatopsis camponoti]